MTTLADTPADQNETPTDTGADEQPPDTDTGADEQPPDTDPGADEQPPDTDTAQAGPAAETIAGLGAKQRAVLQALTAGPTRARDVASALGYPNTSTVTNLLRRLADRDLVARLDDGRWGVAHGADDTLAALFRPSLLGLTGHQRDILDVLAARGEPIRTGELVASLGRPQNNTQATLATLRRRGLVTSPSHGLWTLPGRHLALALQTSAPTSGSAAATGPVTPPVSQTGVALEGDDARFPASTGPEPTSLAVTPRRPWEADQDRPIAGGERTAPKQTNAKLAGSLRQRLDATMRWLEAQDDDTFAATDDVRDVYNLSDAINMALHQWVSRVERDYNHGRPFKHGRRTRAAST